MVSATRIVYDKSSFFPVFAYEQRGSCHADETLRTSRDCYKIVDEWRGDSVNFNCEHLVSIDDDSHWWQLKTAIEKVYECFGTFLRFHSIT